MQKPETRGTSGAARDAQNHAQTDEKMKRRGETIRFDRSTEFQRVKLNKVPSSGYRDPSSRLFAGNSLLCIPTCTLRPFRSRTRKQIALTREQSQVAVQGGIGIRRLGDPRRGYRLSAVKSPAGRQKFLA